MFPKLFAGKYFMNFFLLSKNVWKFVFSRNGGAIQWVCNCPLGTLLLPSAFPAANIASKHLEFIFLSDSYVAFFLAFLKLFLLHAEYRFTCFRIMCCIGCCDCIWLFIQGILPLFVYFHNFFSEWNWLEKVGYSFLRNQDGIICL